MIGAIIEKPEAVENIDENCAVEGLDFVLFGPSNYSVAIVFSGPDKTHQEVQGAIEHTIAVDRNRNIGSMIGIAPDWGQETE